MSVNRVAQDLIHAMNQQKQRPGAYDTKGEVMRITEGIAWVHLAGGVDETPCELTIGASVGDIVQVRVAGGRAWLVGNSTEPPVGDKHVQNIIKKEKKNIVKDVEENVTNIIQNTVVQADNEFVVKPSGVQDNKKWHKIRIPRSSFRDGTRRIADLGVTIDAVVEAGLLEMWDVTLDNTSDLIYNVSVRYLTGDAGQKLNTLYGWTDDYDNSTSPIYQDLYDHSDSPASVVDVYWNTQKKAVNTFAQYASTPTWMSKDSNKPLFLGGIYKREDPNGTIYSLKCHMDAQQQMILILHSSSSMHGFEISSSTPINFDVMEISYYQEG